MTALADACMADLYVAAFEFVSMAVSGWLLHAWNAEEKEFYDT